MKAARPVASTEFARTAPAGRMAAEPRVERLTIDDIVASLKLGWSDFMAKPSHYAMVALIYPLAGLLFASMAAGADLLPILFPAAAGFALVGPIAALPFYEVSRLREAGGEASWTAVFAAMRDPGRGRAIRTMALLLVAGYLLWLLAAFVIYRATLGAYEAQSFSELAIRVLSTPEGLVLFVVGNLVGLAFAVAALMVSLVSFPMILHRGVSAGTAIRTSVEVARRNPGSVLVWGLVVGGLLLLGGIPLFVGLALVVPLLGHATWHLYRRAVGPRPEGV